MINFYDLIEDSPDSLLESYAIELHGDICTTIEENTSLVPITESFIGKVKDAIVNFLKKIGSFIKKWWNKLLRFLGISENKQEKEDTTTTTEQINDDANKTIDETINRNSNTNSQQNDNETVDNDNVNDTTTVIVSDDNEEQPSPEQLKENLEKDREKFIKLCDEILTKGREDNTNKEYDVFKFTSYSIVDNDFGLDTEEKRFKLYKYCIENTTETPFYAVNIHVINKFINIINNETKIYKIPYYQKMGSNAPLYVQFITQYEYLSNILYDLMSKNNIDGFNRTIDKIMKVSRTDDNKIYSDDPDIDIYKLENKNKLYDYKLNYLYKLSSTNNYYILRYAMLTSNMSFTTLLDDVYQLVFKKGNKSGEFDVSTFNDHNYQLLTLIKMMEQKKDEIPDFIRKVTFLKNWHIKSISLKNNAILSKVNMIAKIQNNVKNANRALINKYIREAKIYSK